MEETLNQLTAAVQVRTPNAPSHWFHLNAAVQAFQNKIQLNSDASDVSFCLLTRNSEQIFLFLSFTPEKFSAGSEGDQKV